MNPLEKHHEKLFIRYQTLFQYMELVKKYAQHLDGCGKWKYADNFKCTCGLELVIGTDNEKDG